MTEVLRPGFDYVGVSTPFYCHDSKGRLLLAKRTEQARDEHGRWDPGSGELALGSSVEANILREVREEYGCEGTIQYILPPHSIIRAMEGRETHWLALAAFVLVDPEQVKLMEPDRFSEFGWFTLDALPTPLHEGFRFTLSTYLDDFERMIGGKVQI